MTHSWSPPPLQPFQRLQVTDGLLMNAERWRLAHQYHRQRHNAQYQALQEPGIIYGLGVRVIPAPSDVRSQYQDGRWLEVQPGMAIDVQGNFIVVLEPMPFRLASVNHQAQPLTVYLVIRHVDPDTLQNQGDRALLTESFRLDEKTHPPQELDVELCRITLPPSVSGNDAIALRPAADVFQPGPCEPNFLGRHPIRPRPHGIVRIGMDAMTQAQAGSTPWSMLLDGMEATYPAIRAEHLPDPLPLETPETTADVCDLLYLTVQDATQLDDRALGVLRAHLETGGTVFLEPQGLSASLTEPLNVYRELQVAITQAADDPDLATVRPDLVREFGAIQTQLITQLQADYAPLRELANQFDTTLTSVLQGDSPLRHTPFPFDLLPLVEGVPTFWAIAGGIIVSLGQVTNAWQRDIAPQGHRQRAFPLPTATLRQAQELGSNLLHFVWQRRQLTQWQQGTGASSTRVALKSTATTNSEVTVAS